MQILEVFVKVEIFKNSFTLPIGVYLIVWLSKFIDISSENEKEDRFSCKDISFKYLSIQFI